MSGNAHHTIEENVVGGISSVDEPSVGWGWHQHSAKLGLAVGGFFVLFMLAMLIGNHHGNVENIWLVCVAAMLAFAMFVGLRPKKPKQEKYHELPTHHYALEDAHARGAVASGRTTD